MLSETWFPSSERATATAISASISPQVGILIAMGVTPLVMHSSLTEAVCNKTAAVVSEGDKQVWQEEMFRRWLYYQSAVAGLAVLTMLLTVCGESA